MRQALAIALTASGLFSFFTVHLVEVTPPGWMRIGLPVLAVLALICAASIRRWRPYREQPELRAYLANPLRHGRRAGLASEKNFHIFLLQGEGPRRDTVVSVHSTLRNVSRRPLVSTEYPVAGTSWVRPGEVTVSASADGRPVYPKTSYEDGHSLQVSLPLPAPGLAPGKELDLQLRWSWPYLANLNGGAWVIGLGDMMPGAVLRWEVDYPEDCPQSAELTLVRSLFGIYWDVPAGSVSPRSVPQRLQYCGTMVRRSFDSHLLVDMVSLDGPT